MQCQTEATENIVGGKKNRGRREVERRVIIIIIIIIIISIVYYAIKGSMNTYKQDDIKE